MRLRREHSTESSLSRAADVYLGGGLEEVGAMGSEKKSSAPPSFTWPSLPRATPAGLGTSSSIICVKANRLGAVAAPARERPPQDQIRNCAQDEYGRNFHTPDF